jgi:hypothetical protein
VEGQGGTTVTTGMHLGQEALFISGATAGGASLSASDTGHFVSNWETGNFVSNWETGVYANYKSLYLNNDPVATVGLVQASSAGVSAINELSGVINVVGKNGITVSTGMHQGFRSVLVSGAEQVDTGNFVSKWETGHLGSAIDTGNFVSKWETGNFLSNVETGDASISLTSLQAGKNIHEIKFPYAFAAMPSVTTDLYVDDAEHIIPYALSGVSNTGCFAVFSNNIPAGYTLSTFAASNLGAVLSLSAQYTSTQISASAADTVSPVVSASILNPSNDPIIPHSISGVTQSSYEIIFSDDIPTNNYSVLTYAQTPSAEYNFTSPLPAGSSAYNIPLSGPSKQWFSTPLIKNSLDAVISYPEQFQSAPTVLPCVQVSGENVYIPYNLSGVSASDYSLRFASAIPSDGWSVHTIAHSP